MFRGFYICSLIILFSGICNAWCQDTMGGLQKELLSIQQSDAELLEVLNDQETSMEFESSSKRIDINHADTAGMRILGLTTDQIVSIKTYLKAVGPLKSIYELQAVPYMNDTTIACIRQRIVIMPEKRTIQAQLKEAFHGKTLASMRFNFGSAIDANGMAESGLSKKMLPVHMRFKWMHVSDHMEIRCLGEKDAGEPLRWNSSQRGLDFYSGALMYKGDGKIRQLILGDFEVHMGQGLISWQGIRTHTFAEINNGTPAIQCVEPHKSFEEFRFKRGLAASVQVGAFSATMYYSNKKSDATLASDTINSFQYIQSINKTGLHVSQSSQQNRNNVGETTAGVRFQLKKSSGMLGINLVHQEYGLNFLSKKTLEAVNQVMPRTLFYAGFDYSWQAENIHFFGEQVCLNKTAWAGVHGMAISFSKACGLGFGYRHYALSYVAPDANVLGYRGLPQDETGYWFQMSYKLAKRMESMLSWENAQSGWYHEAYRGPKITSGWVLGVNLTGKRGDQIMIKTQQNFQGGTLIANGYSLPKGFIRFNNFDISYRVKLNKQTLLRVDFHTRRQMDSSSNDVISLGSMGMDLQPWDGWKIYWRLYVSEGPAAMAVYYQMPDVTVGVRHRWVYGDQRGISLVVRYAGSKTWVAGAQADLYKKYNLKKLDNKPDFVKNISLFIQYSM